MYEYFGISDSDFYAFSNNLIRIQYFYGAVIVVPLGIILNTLQIIVFSRSNKFNKTNIGFLYSILSVVDTIGLTWNFVAYKYLPLIDLNLGLVNEFTCFTFQWLSRVLQQLPLYVQAFITFVSYLKVKYPKDYKSLNEQSNIMLIIMVIVVLNGMVNSTNMFRYLSIDQAITNSTLNISQITISCGPSNTIAIVSNFMTSMLRSIIPNVFMCILDYRVLKILFLSKRNLFKTKAVKKKSSNSLKREKNFAFIILLLDIIFFVFNVPLSCTELVQATFQNILLLPASHPTMALINLLHGFTNSLAYIFYVLTFFVNLVFNRVFRSELFAMLFRTQNMNNNNNIQANHQRLAGNCETRYHI